MVGQASDVGDKHRKFTQLWKNQGGYGVSKIKFGTDGWRGVISEDYTFANVRLVAAGIADWVKRREEQSKGIVVGYDARFLSEQYAQDCAAVLADEGIKVWLSSEKLSSPALTWQVKDRQAAGGVMITASHNPPEYNGLKFKAAFGGSASPELVAEIESCVNRLEAEKAVISKRVLPASVEKFSARASYLDHVRRMMDPELLMKFKEKIVFDMMHGSAQGCAADLARTYGLNLTEIRGTFDPMFGGVNPEPIEKNLDALKQAMLEQKAYIGLATDGDGDRIGAVDADGRYITPYEIMCLLMKYLYEKRGLRGTVVQTLTMSEQVMRLTEKYGLKTLQTPVGFKYVAELMLKEDVLIGGEESGGLSVKGYIPERDGILLGFLLIEVSAAYGKTLGQLLDEMAEELGHFYYERRDLHLDPARKDRLMHDLTSAPPATLGGKPVLSVTAGDGTKLVFADGWVIFRGSGTEPIVRVYCEAQSVEAVADILKGAVLHAEKA